MTPYDDIDLVQNEAMQWYIAWRHQAIIWTNVGLSSARSGDIYLRLILWDIPQLLIIKISLTITDLNFNSNL